MAVCDIRRSSICIGRSFITTAENVANVTKYELRDVPSDELTGSEAVTRLACTECSAHDTALVDANLAAFTVPG